MDFDPCPATHAMAPPETGGNAICAVIVAFYPDEDFEKRVKDLLPQVESLLIVDNTPDGGCSPQIKALVTKHHQIQLLENHANRGLAAALNQGLRHALDMRCKWLLTLDQDTTCSADMVTNLTQVYDACQPKPAVVGSNYFDSRIGRLALQTCSESDYIERKTVITSGSLIDAELAHAIGGFRADYFIDQVDHEFCLRARMHGYRIVISSKPAMAHSVGNPGGAQVPFLGTLPNHSPLRKYYIARNTVVTVAKYWRQEPEWCLRRLVRLISGLFLMATLEKHRIAKVRAFAAGITDGLHKRMGASRRHWLR
jgi:rhamnosyltransferase